VPAETVRAPEFTSKKKDLGEVLPDSTFAWLLPTSKTNWHH
jgi:hypothetical protein